VLKQACLKKTSKLSILNLQKSTIQTLTLTKMQS